MPDPRAEAVAVTDRQDTALAVAFGIFLCGLYLVSVLQIAAAFWRDARLADLDEPHHGASSEPEADREPTVLRGFATTYPPDCDGCTGLAGCPGVTLARYGTRDLATARERALARDGLHLIAMRHEDAPCGALVTVRGQGREALAMVADHGPHGQVGPDGAWRASRLLAPGYRWRGIADLPPALGEIVLPSRWRPASGEVTITMEER